MYCIKCGVRLADTEKKCPLCATRVWHPDVEQAPAEPLYPAGKMPRARSGRKTLSGMIVFFFLVPLLVSLFSDLQFDGKMDWFGYVAGAVGVLYVTLALPLWFKTPRPAVFLMGDFASAALYLWYIDRAANGGWFLPFALPVTLGLGLITVATVILVRRLGRGRLYIFGGGSIVLGAFVLMVELLLVKTFQLSFAGWSVYPLTVLALLGGFLIYLGINRHVRENIQRKLFF